jgi:hypothetical protein
MFDCLRWTGVLASGVIGIGLAFWGGSSLPGGEGGGQVRAGTGVAKVTIDYPAERSIFPPEITAPLFMWREPG